MRPAFNCLAVVCFSLLSLATAAHAQSAKTECPTITVDCPAQIIKPGEPATVTANIAAADSTANLTYSWTISAGTITAGQGTPTITVDTTGTAGQTLTATVDVGGLDSSCQRAASCSFRYEMLVSRRFDKYGDLAFVDEKKRLDYFAERLKDESDAQGYILVYSRRGLLRAKRRRVPLVPRSIWLLSSALMRNGW